MIIKILIIFLNKCNLKIKKILLKSFVEGHILVIKMKIDTFYQIKIIQNSQLFYFENDSLKFEQNFNFGSDLILKIYLKSLH